MGRAPCCDKANVKRGPWSPEEDAALRSYIEKHGIGGNWIALPQKAGLKRCGKSCRLRWLNYLRPDIKHGGFTEEEDNVICTLYSKIGSRWSVIASQLSGRTDNDVKNYWNTKLKKKLMAKQANLLMASNTVNHISYSQTQTPPPPPPVFPKMAIKAEPYAANGYFMTLESNSEVIYQLDHHFNKFYSELAPFTSLIEQGELSGSISGQLVSPPSEEASAASTTASSNSYINWPASGASADEMFLSQLGFGDAEDLFVCQEKPGEVYSPCLLSSIANMWATTESKSQGLSQGLTYS